MTRSFTLAPGLRPISWQPGVANHNPFTQEAWQRGRIWLDSTKRPARFSRTAFKEEEIVGSAERHHNTLWQGIVKFWILGLTPIIFVAIFPCSASSTSSSPRVVRLRTGPSASISQAVRCAQR